MLRFGTVAGSHHANLVLEGGVSVHNRQVGHPASHGALEPPDTQTHLDPFLSGIRPTATGKVAIKSKGERKRKKKQKKKNDAVEMRLQGKQLQRGAAKNCQASICKMKLQVVLQRFRTWPSPTPGCLVSPLMTMGLFAPMCI